MRDFNAVRKPEERVGNIQGATTGSSREIVEFNNFIDDVLLQDISLTGRRFTWYRVGGGAKSRIDRVLVSQEWL